MVTLTLGDRTGWRPCVVHHPTDEPAPVPPGSADGLRDSTGIGPPIAHRHADRSSYTSNDLTTAEPPLLTSSSDVLSSGGIIPATR